MREERRMAGLTILSAEVERSMCKEIEEVKKDLDYSNYLTFKKCTVELVMVGS